MSDHERSLSSFNSFHDPFFFYVVPHTRRPPRSFFPGRLPLPVHELRNVLKKNPCFFAGPMYFLAPPNSPPFSLPFLPRPPKGRFFVHVLAGLSCGAPRKFTFEPGDSLTLANVFFLLPFPSCIKFRVEPPEFSPALMPSPPILLRGICDMSILF